MENKAVHKDNNIYEKKVYIIKKQDKDLGFFCEIYNYKDDEHPLRVLITNNLELKYKYFYNLNVNGQKIIIPLNIKRKKNTDENIDLFIFTID